MFATEAYGFKRSVGEILRSQVWIAILDSSLWPLPKPRSLLRELTRFFLANLYPFQDAQRVSDCIKALGDVVARIGFAQDLSDERGGAFQGQGMT